MSRVVIQEGYNLPFAGKSTRRRSKASRRAAKRLGSKMRACGTKWRKKSPKFRKTHKWTAFIKKHC